MDITPEGFPITGPVQAEFQKIDRWLADAVTKVPEGDRMDMNLIAVGHKLDRLLEGLALMEDALASARIGGDPQVQ